MTKAQRQAARQVRRGYRHHESATVIVYWSSWFRRLARWCVKTQRNL